MPNYQEANPTVIAIVTFPFLFGMMFGDIGHGSVILSFGLVLVLFDGSLKNSIASILLPYRYLVLFLGFMSTYCGFIYNEFFALPLNLFTSCYDVDSRD